MNSGWDKGIIASMALGLSAVAGCSTLGDNPSLPLADKKGTARFFVSNEAETIAAITNAFANYRYRGMSLYDAIGQDYLALDWHPTNGFVLEPVVIVSGSITNIAVGTLIKRRLPYIAYFHIVAVPNDTNGTTVTVRTVLAEVIDGREPGIHGGWANHHRKVPPIRQEEENVLAAIAKELSSIKKP